MSDSTDTQVYLLPTPAEFLKQIRELCDRLGWIEPHSVSCVLGSIMECLLKEGKKTDYLNIVSEFSFIKASTTVLSKENPEDWTKRILGEKRE